MRLYIISLIILILNSCIRSDNSRKEIFSLSNGLVKVDVNKKTGLYSFIDLARGDTVIQSAGFNCLIDNEYIRGRARIKIFRSVEDSLCNSFTSSDENRVNSVEHGKIEPSLGEGSFIKLISRLEGKNVLFSIFTIYNNQAYIDISWGYQNLTNKPVQIQKADLLFGAKAFPASSRSDEYYILDGNGGGPDNSVKKVGDVLSYNNLLLSKKREGEEQTQNIVIGGITYEDYVKFAEVIEGEPKKLSLYAEDPVGKRVDPDETYISPDRFYLEYSSPCPFEALELYGQTLSKAQRVELDYYTFPSVCMWFLSVKHFGGDNNATNDTPGAVKEMRNAVNSGFLKYTPVCIRMVPDNYEQNNEQGWWDDKHWQMYGRKERCIVEGGHYKPPYETTEKWAREIINLGGIPITYIEPGVRSEDYADIYPNHMLFNESHRYILRDGERVIVPHGIMGKIYQKMYQESYDYTDTWFINHIKDVYRNLQDGGVRGSFYDYPERAFPILGGMEDKYSTAASHYRNVFRLAYNGFGKPSYIQERNISMGSDITLGVVTSQRTQGDNNILLPKAVRSAGLRWYKNRSVINYDMDGKALLVKGSRQDIPISKEERRAILTMSYTVTGRLLLTESFSRFNEEVLHDLSRIYPFHSTKLSPRPVDAFISEIPKVYDFVISPDWHQVVLYNDDKENEKEIIISLSGEPFSGALGLDQDKKYHIYDYWNNKYNGLVNGSVALTQNLRKGEARMLSIHEQNNHPQFISTNRHIMQGYVDMVKKPVWNKSKMELSGISSVIEDEPYSIIIALNGYSAVNVNAENSDCDYELLGSDDQLVKITIRSDKNQNTEWFIKFIK